MQYYRGAALALALTGAAAPTHAQTLIDFEDLATPLPVVCNTGPYYSGSYRVTVDGLTSCNWGTTIPDYPGSTAMFSNYALGGMHLLRPDGKPFDVFAISLAHFSTAASGPMTVFFTGYRTDLTVVTQNFIIPAKAGATSPSLSIYSFSSGFNNLTLLDWQDDDTGSAMHQFDDIRVRQSVTPEPISMSLIATGLAGISAARRRRRT